MSLRIVVLHERDSFGEFMVSLLQAEGHLPVSAGACQEAIRKGGGADLIIIEITRNQIGAVDLVQKLHRSRITSGVPIIIVSESQELEFELLNVFDFLLKPIDITRLRDDLKMLAEGEKRPHPVHEEPLTNQEYELFHEFLIKRTGLHFERRNIKILLKGLSARMAALRIGSYRKYFEYLKKHQHDRQELQRLLPFLTVGETYFFRYSAHFEVLRKYLHSEIIGSNRKRIRFWSAGCSTGEEAYSIAMAIMESLPDWRSRDVRVIATDINNRSLQRAREGVYSPWAMRAVGQGQINRYFRKVGRSYIVNDDVKRLVEFSHLNLQMEDFPKGEFQDFDAIFCRNVMIYFSLGTTKEIVEKLSAALKPNGLFFLGHAETLMNISSGFERHTHGGGFYYRKRGHLQSLPLPEKPAKPRLPRQEDVPAPRGKGPAPAVSAPQLRVVPPVKESRPAPQPDELLVKARHLFEAENFKESAQLLAQLLQLEPRHKEGLLLQGFIEANRGRFDEALRLCREVLEVDDLLPEAYFLRGMVFDMTDREEEAIPEYRKAILLKMDFVMAHYYLGRLLFRMGKSTDGNRQLRNALKVLEKGEIEQVIPLSGGLSREVLIQQVRNELGRVI